LNDDGVFINAKRCSDLHSSAGFEPNQVTVEVDISDWLKLSGSKEPGANKKKLTKFDIPCPSFSFFLILDPNPNLSLFRHTYNRQRWAVSENSMD
jgi:hypothetical protein